MSDSRWCRVVPPALALLFLAPAGAPAQEAMEGVVDLQPAAWLAGCWRVISQDGINAADEQWMQPMGGIMVGMSRTVRGGQARGYELLTLRVENGRLIYHAAPSGQAPTDFPATSIEDGPTTHCGYHNLRIGRFVKLQIGDFMHQLHHRYCDCNYGSYETPWDKLFGSFHDGTAEGDALIKKRRRQSYEKKSQPA